MTAMLEASDRAPTTSPPAKRSRRRRRDLSVLVTIAACTVLVVVGSAYPIGAVLATALSAEALPKYVEFFTSPVKLEILWNTIQLGFWVGALGTALGFLFAFVQARLDVPGKRVLHVMALVPMISPPFAVAIAMIKLYGNRGLVTHGLLGVDWDIYGLSGMVFALTLSLFPVAYLSLLGMMRALDPALEEAAMNMGASRWQIFRTVLLPLLAPGLVAPFLLLFVEAIADLANPLVLGGDYNVLASSIYMEVTAYFDIPNAAVLSLILLLPSLSLFVVQRYWLQRKVRTTVTGKPSGSVHLIRGWVRWPIYAMAVSAALVIASLYGTIILGAVTANFGVVNTLTLQHLEQVLFGPGQEALLDTTLLAAVATPVAGIFGLLIAWLVVRHLRASAGWMDFAATLGIAVPGTVLGIGYLIAYHYDLYVGDLMVFPSLVGNNSLGGAAIAILLVFTIRAVPTGLRTGSAALTQLHPQLEEASTSLGASPLRTFRLVTLPLIRPALLTGLNYSFAHSMTSVSAIILLVTPDTKIITSQIFDAANQGRLGVAYAYSTVLIAIVLASFGLIRLIVGRTATLNRVSEAAGGQTR